MTDWKDEEFWAAVALNGRGDIPGHTVQRILSTATIGYNASYTIAYFEHRALMTCEMAKRRG